jgi:hypothetical protein
MASARISRRSVLGSVGAASLTPGLLSPETAQASLRADQIIDAPGVRPAFAAELALGAIIAQQGAPSQLWAAIQGGSVTGRLLCGAVQQGRIQWRSDPAAGLLEVTTSFTVLRDDGTLVEVQDRGVAPASGETPAAVAICTAPVLLQGGLPAPAALLVGRLDPANVATGVLRLHVFEAS